MIDALRPYEHMVNLLSLPEYNRTWIINELEKLSHEPKRALKEGNFLFHYKDKVDERTYPLADYLLFHMLSDDALVIKYEGIDDRHRLWHCLSVLVGQQEIPNMRNKLTKEIYDNESYQVDPETAGRFFVESEYLLFGLTIVGVKVMGVIKKDQFPTFKDVASYLSFNPKELR